MRLRARRIRRYGHAYAFIAPAMVLLAVFVAYPVVRSIQLSLYSWDGLTEPIFIGLRNFQEFAQDPFLPLALGNTIKFAVGTTAGTIGIGFLLALAIQSRVRGWRIFKVAYFTPVMVSMTVTGLLWDQLLIPGDTPINRFLNLLHVQHPPVWLGDASTALPTIIAVTVWQFSGFPMIIFLAAMENIPRDLEEAAQIEGANHWQRTRYVIYPLIKPVIAIVVLLQLIFSLRVFDIVWVMSRGGPGNASVVLGVYLYEEGFVFSRFGYASAIAVLMTVIIATLTLAYLRFVRPERHEY
jgi:ABC-type sugar transport system permease subunit